LNAFAERHQVKVIRHAWKMPQHAPKPPAKPKGYAQAGKQFLKQWTKRYRIDMSDPGPRTDTTLALIGEKIVTAHDPLLGERYHREVMKAKWSNGADLSNIETLGVIISSLGLDKRDFVQALQAPDAAKRLEDDYRLAESWQVTTIPAFFTSKQALQVHHFEQLPTEADLEALFG
jgi:predicted DsbA family dithiol-disulfide isomerase